jgi:hypothetical protein
VVFPHHLGSQQSQLGHVAFAETVPSLRGIDVVVSGYLHQVSDVGLQKRSIAHGVDGLLKAPAVEANELV